MRKRIRLAAGLRMRWSIVVLAMVLLGCCIVPGFAEENVKGSYPVDPVAKTNRDHVALMVSHSLYRELKPDIQQYKVDVEARFPAQLHIVEGAWDNPARVRATIKDLYNEEKISGVVLVGALPMHRFFMHEYANPNPLYYEDFDLEFVDNDKNGVDDAYKGKPQLKVWVASIRACEKPADDDIPGLHRFFSKTHDYYTGKTVPEPRTLLFNADEGPEAGDWFRRRGGTKFSTPENITLLTGKGCTLKAARKAFKKHSYTLTCVGVHSDETGHALVDEDLMAQEIADMKTGSLITISHGCFAANWPKNYDEKSGPNCAMSWVFGKHLGQAVVAQVRSGGVGFDDLIYARLRAGDYLGKAYLPCKQAHEIEASPGDHTSGDIVSGIIFIGNPFLELKPVNTRSRLAIRNAVYGDFDNNAVTNVTQLLADWVDDNTLTVEVPNDYFGDPANGIVKQLKVDYTFDGKEASKSVNDGETLKIRKVQCAKETGKLVIVKAVYGDLPDGDKVDVTKKVSELVKDNALSVSADNETFGDPAEGVGKKLKVDYKYNGVDKSNTVEEGETLAISNLPNVMAASSSLTLTSSSSYLVSAFNWNKSTALGHVMSGKPGCIPCYDAGLHSAWCVRDVAHMAEGADLLSLTNENLTMWKTWAAMQTPARQYFTIWEVNFDGSICTCDGGNYENDKCFVREIPSVQDLVGRAWDNFEWTGDPQWVTNIALVNFYKLAMSNNIAYWDSNSDNIAEGVGNSKETACGSYCEGNSGYKQGGDNVAVTWDSYNKYAKLLTVMGKTSEAAFYQSKANSVSNYYVNSWWNSSGSNYYAGKDLDGNWVTTQNQYNKETYYFQAMKGLAQPGARASALLNSINDNASANKGNYNQESFTMVPECFYNYGQNDKGWYWLKYIMDSHYNYPEVSFLSIATIATGLMGISPDAPNHKVATLGRLTSEVSDVQLDHIPFGANDIMVKHGNANNTTTIKNNSGPASLTWEARFAGSRSTLYVDGVTQTASRKAINGVTVSYVTVTLTVGQQKTVTTGAAGTP